MGMLLAILAKWLSAPRPPTGKPAGFGSFLGGNSVSVVAARSKLKFNLYENDN
jgi:hypothetical protein